jgi:hypothetical protein
MGHRRPTQSADANLQEGFIWFRLVQADDVKLLNGAHRGAAGSGEAGAAIKASLYVRQIDPVHEDRRLQLLLSADSGLRRTFRSGQLLL